MLQSEQQLASFPASACFSARPYPTTARLISAGAVLDHRQAGFGGREQRDAARVAELERAAHVLRIENVLDRDALGTWRASKRGQPAVNDQSAFPETWRGRGRQARRR